MIKIMINNTNAAFYSDDPSEPSGDKYDPLDELARVLRVLAEDLEDVAESFTDPKILTSMGNIYDRNGNVIGSWEHTHPRPGVA
jgi:hypothetical protein